MRVKFKYPYFAPGEAAKRPDGNPVSGVRYPKGICEVPDGTAIPSSAEIIKEELDPRVKEEVAKSIREYDHERAVGNATEEAVVKAKEQVEYDKNEEQRTKRPAGRPKKYK